METLMCNKDEHALFFLLKNGGCLEWKDENVGRPVRVHRVKCGAATKKTAAFSRLISISIDGIWMGWGKAPFKFDGMLVSHRCVWFKRTQRLFLSSLENCTCSHDQIMSIFWAVLQLCWPWYWLCVWRNWMNRSGMLLCYATNLVSFGSNFLLLTFLWLLCWFGT
jgi:hypothetical protein